MQNVQIIQKKCRTYHHNSFHTANTNIKISDNKTLKSEQSSVGTNAKNEISVCLTLILKIDKNEKKAYGGKLKWQVEAEQTE